ncbi:MAG: FHA domain-containing protein, partial [Gammaproteobacteria bacterium]
RREQNGYFIRDLNSTNGIYLGKQRIKKRTLRDGDIVSLGKHSLVFLDGAADDDEADEIDDSDDEELEDSDAERKDNAA